MTTITRNDAAMAQARAALLNRSALRAATRWFAMVFATKALFVVAVAATAVTAVSVVTGGTDKVNSAAAVVAAVTLVVRWVLMAVCVRRMPHVVATIAARDAARTKAALARASTPRW